VKVRRSGDSGRARDSQRLTSGATLARPRELLEALVKTQDRFTQPTKKVVSFANVTIAVFAGFTGRAEDFRFAHVQYGESFLCVKDMQRITSICAYAKIGKTSSR
jgi:hypothetical protein